MDFATRATPHTRGSTPLNGFSKSFHVGYPAYAGIDLILDYSAMSCYRLPRIRGDRPCWYNNSDGAGLATPHTRGSTAIVAGVTVLQTGYPAYAGIDLLSHFHDSNNLWLPRIRGDRPWLRRHCFDTGMATPHTRGSTRRLARESDYTAGYPAYAGIDL